MVFVASGDDIARADAVSFGSPTRLGSVADEVYAAFTSTNTAHGGQETRILSLYATNGALDLTQSDFGVASRGRRDQRHPNHTVRRFR